MIQIIFQNSEYFWFLLLIPWIIITHLFVVKHIKKKAIVFANFEALKRVVYEKKKALTRTNKIKPNLGILITRLLALIFLVFSLANPILLYEGETNQVDYVIAIDSSSSMLADDLVPNRFTVAKNTAKMFLNLIKGSKVGLISFAGSTKIVSLLTDDYEKLKALIDSLNILDIPGTDLGEAIITAVNLLKSSSKKTGHVILITDGRSTVGTDINDAISYAIKNNVVVHTIGVGTEQGGEFIKDAFTKIDEEQLKMIANSTNGKFFRATDKDSLGMALKEISEIKKGKIPFNLSSTFLVLAIITLALEWGIINTKHRTIP